MNLLAVVIPAYKIEFLEQTLVSISNQTSKDFKLYIGDDASSDDLYSIVRQYEQNIDIHYKRFENNLGSIDLVAHWERCIDLVNGEEWIWLFSDDDIMDNNCVDSFYKIMNQNLLYDIFHFNVKVIDENNKLLSTTEFPEIYSVEDFVKDRLKGINESFAVEYVFNKSSYMENDKFQKFDLAWCSDDATWIKLGKKNGIKTIENSFVSWRRSNHNISCNSENKTILDRKYYAFIEFALWLKDFISLMNVNIDTYEFDNYIKTWFHNKIKSSIPFIKNKDIISFANMFNVRLKHMYFNTLDKCCMIIINKFYLIKKYIKSYIRKAT